MIFRGYLRDLFYGRLWLYAANIGVLVTLVTFLYPGSRSWDLQWKVITVFLVMLLFLISRLIYAGFHYYQGLLQPITVRSVTRGQAWYEGIPIFVLEHRPWLTEGQLLELQVTNDDVTELLGIIEITGFTHPNGSHRRKYPMANLVLYFREDQPLDYVEDWTRRKSLQADSVIMGKTFYEHRRGNG